MALNVRWQAVLALVLAIAVHAPLLGAPFLWDDKTLILESPVLSNPARLPEALRRDFWALSANPREAGMYRPLVTLSYFGDRLVFGTDPLGPHAVNLALHLLAAFLVGWLALALGTPAPGAVGAAALFSVHPATVEAVANVASRPDLLATVWLLLAFGVLRRPGRGRLAVAAVLVALAQLSKESAFVALPLALVLELFVAGGPPLRTRLRDVTLALGAATLAVLVLRRAVLGAAVRLEPEGWTPLVVGASNVVRYAARAAWPVDLVPYLPSTQPSAWALAALLAALGAALAVRRWAGAALFAAAWFLVATAPVAGWAPVTVRFSGLLLYLPLTGLALFAASGLAGVHRFAPAAVALVLAAASARVVPQWSSDETLWAANVEAAPELPAPRVNLANALAEQKSPEAEAHYEAAIDVAARAGDNKSLSLACMGLGNLWLPREPARAEGHFRRAIAASSGRLWQAGVNLAVSLAMQGRGDEAEAALEQQWQVTPLAAVASAAVQLAARRNDAAAQARWRARLEARR